MNKDSKFSFNGPEPNALVNFALVAILTFYIILIGFFLINTEICGILASDYCAYWSAGRIINEHSMSAVYDLELLSEYQRRVYPHGDSSFFEPFGIMYLPIFLLPFQILSFLPIPYSYLIWTLINLFAFILYLRYFAKKTTGGTLPSRLLMMMIICLPFFINVREGQVNVWLVICAGEFMRGVIADKHIRAGLWLGGWLIKPQLFIVILPFLLIKRSGKVLLGLLISSVLIIGISISLIGVAGSFNLLNVIMQASEGGVISNIPAMMNWRMLGWHITSFTSPFLGLLVTAIGSLTTIGFALFFFKKNNWRESIEISIALLGIFAATTAVSWHAHYHMSIIFIPAMILLILHDRFNKKLFFVWLFLPLLIEILNIVLTGLVFSGGLHEFFLRATKLMYGLRGLALNLVIFGWAIYQHTPKSDKRFGQITGINPG